MAKKIDPFTGKPVQEKKASSAWLKNHRGRYKYNGDGCILDTVTNCKITNVEQTCNELNDLNDMLCDVFGEFMQHIFEFSKFKEKSKFSEDFILRSKQFRERYEKLL